jgi:hypothetical protein
MNFPKRIPKNAIQAMQYADDPSRDMYLDKLESTLRKKYRTSSKSFVREKLGAIVVLNHYIGWCCLALAKTCYYAFASCLLHSTQPKLHYNRY